MHVEDLPLEILTKIFQMLKIEDLKSIVLVSRYFRIIGEDPCLWKSIEIPDVHPDDLEALLSLPRLSKLQSLHISDWLLEDHFRQLEHKVYLKFLSVLSYLAIYRRVCPRYTVAEYSRIVPMR